MIDVELKRRIGLWQKLLLIPEGEVTSGFLREQGIYGGAQGIYVDKSNTAQLTKDGLGVTVSVLHTGDFYPDELSSDGLIYHYPRTGRPVTRDRNEIAATKNTMSLNLPLFTILPGKTKKLRKVKLSWVMSFDDASEIFWIDFANEKPVYKHVSESDPFNLTENKSSKTRSSKVRDNQQKFRFEVIQNYGLKCAVCDIDYPKLLDAAHIREKEESGSDDWRNGILFCKNHHSAFDNALFGVDPDNKSIEFSSKNFQQDLHFSESELVTSSGKFPHIEALKWKWKQFQNSKISQRE